MQTHLISTTACGILTDPDTEGHNSSPAPPALPSCRTVKRSRLVLRVGIIIVHQSILDSYMQGLWEVRTYGRPGVGTNSSESDMAVLPEVWCSQTLTQYCFLPAPQPHLEQQHVCPVSEADQAKGQSCNCLLTTLRGPRTVLSTLPTGALQFRPVLD